jgi:hypothetical protein
VLLPDLHQLKSDEQCQPMNLKDWVIGHVVKREEEKDVILTNVFKKLPCIMTLFKHKEKKIIHRSGFEILQVNNSHGSRHPPCAQDT